MWFAKILSGREINSRPWTKHEGRNLNVDQIEAVKSPRFNKAKEFSTTDSQLIQPQALGSNKIPQVSRSTGQLFFGFRNVIRASER